MFAKNTEWRPKKSDPLVRTGMLEEKWGLENDVQMGTIQTQRIQVEAGCAPRSPWFFFGHGLT